MKLVNIHKLATILILLTTLGSLNAQEVWTLNQCIDSALVYNKNLQMGRNNIAIGEQRHKEATASLIPKITVNADYKYFSELPHQLMPLSAFNPAAPEWKFQEVQFGVPHNINANIMLSMPLYNPQVYGAISATGTARELTELQYLKTEEQVYQEITTIYYNARILHHQLTFIDSNLVNTRKLLKSTELLHAQLLAKSTDVNKVKLQEEQLKTMRETVSSKSDLALSALKLAVGLPPDKEIAIDPEIRFELLPEYQVSPTLDFRIAGLQRTLLQSELKTLNRTRFLPSVGLVASYGTTGFGYDKKPNEFLDFYEVSFAGIQLNYPLFNGLVTHRKVKQKKIELSNNELQTSLIADRDRSQIENARQQQSVARKSVSDSDEQIKLAQAIYDQTILQQKQGIASLTDVLLADNALMQAQQNYLTSVTDYLKADLELRKLTGNMTTKK